MDTIHNAIDKMVVFDEISENKRASICYATYIYIYINVLGGSMICAASAICEI